MGGLHKRELVVDKEIFFVSFLYWKGRNNVCTCVMDHTIEEKDQYIYVGLCGFDYKLFEEE